MTAKEMLQYFQKNQKLGTTKKTRTRSVSTKKKGTSTVTRPFSFHHQAKLEIRSLKNAKASSINENRGQEGLKLQENCDNLNLNNDLHLKLNENEWGSIGSSLMGYKKDPSDLESHSAESLYANIITENSENPYSEEEPSGSESAKCNSTVDIEIKKTEDSKVLRRKPFI